MPPTSTPTSVNPPLMPELYEDSLELSSRRGSIHKPPFPFNDFVLDTQGLQTWALQASCAWVPPGGLVRVQILIQGARAGLRACLCDALLGETDTASIAGPRREWQGPGEVARESSAPERAQLALIKFPMS